MTVSTEENIHLFPPEFREGFEVLKKAEHTIVGTKYYAAQKSLVQRKVCSIDLLL